MLPERPSAVLNAIAEGGVRKDVQETARAVDDHGTVSSDSVVPAPVEIRSGYSPGCIGRIGELHGRYYATAWGSGAAFEVQMLRELCTFVEEYDHRRDLLLTAHVADVMIGSTVVIGAPESPEARLRWVIVDPRHHGKGAGKAMLAAALAWCRERQYQTVFLWTVDGLPASRTMYERAGFRVTARARDTRYSVPLTSLKMELSLRARSPDIDRDA